MMPKQLARKFLGGVVELDTGDGGQQSGAGDESVFGQGKFEEAVGHPGNYQQDMWV